MTHERAGTVATPADLVDLPRLVTAYYTRHPDPSHPAEQVSFGTSGHRGSSLAGTFTDDHIAATTQAIVDYRAMQGTTGPLVLGRDTHALSEPAYRTAREVLVANGVSVLVDPKDGYLPTPVVSHAILTYNRGRTDELADGIVITPSHNPPADGGFKYNPPHGGPADTEATSWIAQRANDLLSAGLQGVARTALPGGADVEGVRSHDMVGDYVADLPSVVDIEAIRRDGVRLGVDPMGGASVAVWDRIAQVHQLDLTVINPLVDATWRFMTLDHDGKIRMDCSSPWAMASVVENRRRYDVSIGNDADADRHGIVTPDAGLMNPNHFLAVAIDYLLSHRPQWRDDVAIGKTVVSSSLIDRVVAAQGRDLVEVPVGFKWFVPGLLDGTVGFGGEESAGASFLRHDGTTWTTDKDGIILGLLAAEITATTETSPSQHLERLVASYGASSYARTDTPATREEKARLATLSPEQVTASTLAGDKITAVVSEAPGNGAALGGIKVATAQAWFAARPSGTEDLYKVYAESFAGEEHLANVQEEARSLVAAALSGGDDS